MEPAHTGVLLAGAPGAEPASREYFVASRGRSAGLASRVLPPRWREQREDIGCRANNRGCQGLRWRPAAATAVISAVILGALAAGPLALAGPAGPAAGECGHSGRDPSGALVGRRCDTGSAARGRWARGHISRRTRRPRPALATVGGPFRRRAAAEEPGCAVAVRRRSLDPRLAAIPPLPEAGAVRPPVRPDGDDAVEGAGGARLARASRREPSRATASRSR